MQDRQWLRFPAAAPAGYRRWLVGPGSLTRRIRARCSAFEVRVVSQGLGRASREETFLGGSRARAMIVRDVLLCCGGIPVVFAHSVMRHHDVRGPWRFLGRLGSRPLGEALFANPVVRRGPLRFRRLGAHDALRARIAAALGPHAPAHWARRSLFVLRGSPILVTEVFLPEILGL